MMQAVFGPEGVRTMAQWRLVQGHVTALGAARSYARRHGLAVVRCEDDSAIIFTYDKLTRIGHSVDVKEVRWLDGSSLGQALLGPAPGEGQPARSKER